MKARICRTEGWLTAGAIVLLQISTSLGAEPTDAVAPPPAEPAAQLAAKVPYGVDDVLKLNKAKISENIILTYVQTSGTTYSLAPNDIVYLKEQGVADSVVTAMLDTQRKASQAVAAQAAQAQAQPVQAAPNPAPSTPLYAPAPATTYAQPADTTAYVQPASSTYVIPYPQATYAYYGGGYSYWPSFYWGSSYCYPGYSSCYRPYYSGCYNYGYKGCYNYGYNGNYYHNGFYNGYHNNGNGSHGGGGGFYNGAHAASVSHASSVSHGSSGFHSAPRAMRTAGHR